MTIATRRIPVRWLILGLTLAYGVVMTGAVLILAWLSYRIRLFRRGDAA
ncbi:MAG: hypothetical protein WCN95_14005 [bacterium]